MIDIHTHVLPGIDDGSDSWDTTLKLVRAAAAEGITTLIATPHHADGRYANEAAAVEELTRIANERLAEEGIPVLLLPGQEIRVHDGLLDAWQRGELLSLAGSRYVLLEMPSSRIPIRMEEWIYELGLLGITAVIAHPERNAEVAKTPDSLSRLVNAGASVQVTTHSLLGGFGKSIERTSWSLCEAGLVHAISSDAHHPEHRGFRLREAYEAIRLRMGETWSDYYAGNASNIANDRALAEQPPIPSRTKASLSRFLSYFNRR
ncbi:tyrosine-protein phosphatase [Cohnella sp. GCM10027633]|uniref:tyrosine-protein phosphatase n=1 Tax=unclassified Cohnella TaxID=2636738 RepID=UPI003625183F